NRLQEGSHLLPQLLLDVIDRAPRVDVPEVELVGHRRVLPQQLVLVRAEAVVDVVAVLEVHPRLPEVHSAGLEDAADQGCDVDLEIEDEMGSNGEAVQAAQPGSIDAPDTSARERREDVPIGQDDETSLEGWNDFLLEAIGKVGRVEQDEGQLVERVARLRQL